MEWKTWQLIQAAIHHFQILVNDGKLTRKETIDTYNRTIYSFE